MGTDFLRPHYVTIAQDTKEIVLIKPVSIVEDHSDVQMITGIKMIGLEFRSPTNPDLNFSLILARVWKRSGNVELISTHIEVVQ